MAIITTARNHVYAYEVQADDTHVQTIIRSPTERYVLTTQGIEEYQTAVAWATSMADEMAHPLTVLPISAPEFMQANRARLENGLSRMTDAERDELREVVVNRLLETMRDNDDPAMRAEAFEVLKMMKVTQ